LFLFLFFFPKNKINTNKNTNRKLLNFTSNTFIQGAWERAFQLRLDLFLGLEKLKSNENLKNFQHTHPHFLHSSIPQVLRFSSHSTIIPTPTSIGLKRLPNDKSKRYELDEMLNFNEKKLCWVAPLRVEEIDVLILILILTYSTITTIS